MIFYTGDNYTKSMRLNNRAKSHGKWGTKTYLVWHQIKQRCLNKNCNEYYNYGGRGIGICEKWLSFEGFLEDMGESPKDYEIDRIDGSLGYCKENCRWVSKIINRVNRRRAIKSKLPRGVSKSGDKYRAFITIYYVQYHLGVFDTPEEAHKEYVKISKEWWGFTPDYKD